MSKYSKQYLKLEEVSKICHIAPKHCFTFILHCLEENYESHGKDLLPHFVHQKEHIS